MASAQTIILSKWAKNTETDSGRVEITTHVKKAQQVPGVMSIGIRYLHLEEGRWMNGWQVILSPKLKKSP